MMHKQLVSLGVIFILLAGISCWLFITDHYGQDVEVEFIPDETSSSSAVIIEQQEVSSTWETYESKELGITFNNPNDWLRLATTTPQARAMLVDFNNSTFIAYKPKTACVIAIGQMATPNIFMSVNNAQNTLRPDETSEEDILVGNTIATRKFISYEDYSVPGRPEAHYNRVIASYVALGDKNYVISSGALDPQFGSNMRDGADCEYEFIEMLNKAVVIGREVPAITSTTDAKLSVRWQYRADNSVIVSYDDGRRYVQTHLDVNGGSASYYIAHDGIYYVSGTDGQLHHRQLIGDKDVAVPLLGVTATTGASNINHFKIINNKIYYLAGENCNEYRARCDNALYVKDLVTGKNEMILAKIESRDILGIENGLLYMAWTDGDAGLYWATYEIVDLNKKKVIDTFGYSRDCMDEGPCLIDKESAKHQDKVDLIKKLFPSKAKYTAVLIRNGEIIGYDPESLYKESSYGSDDEVLHLVQ